MAHFSFEIYLKAEVLERLKEIYDAEHTQYNDEMKETYQKFINWINNFEEVE